MSQAKIDVDYGNMEENKEDEENDLEDDLEALELLQWMDELQQLDEWEEEEERLAIIERFMSQPIERGPKIHSVMPLGFDSALPTKKNDQEKSDGRSCERHKRKHEQILSVLSESFIKSRRAREECSKKMAEVGECIKMNMQLEQLKLLRSEQKSIREKMNVANNEERVKLLEKRNKKVEDKIIELYKLVFATSSNVVEEIPTDDAGGGEAFDDDDEFLLMNSSSSSRSHK